MAWSCLIAFRSQMRLSSNDFHPVREARLVLLFDVIVATNRHVPPLLSS